ncbi:MAG TPA: M56 family metallopeptidase [Candidatus Binataceae bacterium]|nr:M56 family metallopeptidase [Candidatus Binataceae bacterium]
MERESLLTLLVALLSGVAILACGWWPVVQAGGASGRQLERLMWKRIWLPAIPGLMIAAWLCGWALVEPDPTPESVPSAILLASIPLLFLFARAAVRATWSLLRNSDDLGTATVGLLAPRILFSPYLAKKLDDRVMEAALEHERAHVRHRDPLRIWLAQLMTDLQWPWPQAQQRLRLWLLALELARDEEARCAGVEGADLADAVLACARLGEKHDLRLQAALAGDPIAFKERIARLLRPLPSGSEAIQASARGTLTMLLPTLLLAVALGSIFGERLVSALFRIAA